MVEFKDVVPKIQRREHDYIIHTYYHGFNSGFVANQSVKFATFNAAVQFIKDKIYGSKSQHEYIDKHGIELI